MRRAASTLSRKRPRQQPRSRSAGRQASRAAPPAQPRSSWAAGLPHLKPIGGGSAAAAAPDDGGGGWASGILAEATTVEHALNNAASTTTTTAPPPPPVAGGLASLLHGHGDVLSGATAARPPLHGTDGSFGPLGGPYADEAPVGGPYVDLETAPEEEAPPMDPLMVAQLDLEEETTAKARVDHMEMVEDMKNMGQASRLRPLQSVMCQWYEPMVEAVKREQALVAENEPGNDRYVCGPFLVLLPPEQLACITMYTALNAAFKTPTGVSISRLMNEISDAVQAEVNYAKLQARAATAKAVPRGAAAPPGTATSDRWVLNGLDGKGVGGQRHLKRINMRAKRALSEADWGAVVRLKLGAVLVKMLLELARDTDTGEACFEHEIDSSLLPGLNRLGIFKCSPELLQMVEETYGPNASSPFPRHLPMLVPPKQWSDWENGGYMATRTTVMRGASRTQNDLLKQTRPRELGVFYDALNVLGSLPWRVNPKVLAAATATWEGMGKGGDPIADLPSHANLDLPVFPEAADGEDVPAEENRSYWQRVRKAKQHNANLHSLRSDVAIKLGIAQRFAEHDEIFFPHNVDFRGRAYPVPPNLNHMGSDICRGLLVFAEAKPLGSSGLRWLKIHLANLYGMSKSTMDEKEAFIDANLAEVVKVHKDPLGPEGRWWLTAESPWQALAACLEIGGALESGDPESYECALPVHMDGSCNGLQHYAALGRDAQGGTQVNLTPNDRPQDVYIGVCDRVREKVTADAEKALGPDATEAEAKVQQMAQFCEGMVDRKTVKQTVMTSVYGVTFIGARKQIYNRLEDKLEAAGTLTEENEALLYGASLYLARVTMGCLEDLFPSARQIMGWLAKCANIVAHEGHAVQWKTPLQLPCMQPYRYKGKYQVKTVLQTVLTRDQRDHMPVSKVRQTSAFPPNFVHSLDSTHMMLTAVAMRDRGKCFAAVHDSYWTHPCDIDVMNDELRNAFVDLYDRPILEDFHRATEEKYGVSLPELPDRGELDLNEVRGSTYFFS